ncbi:MAG: hypothetical protein ACHQ1G_10535 [Planctomycetota bacterium]
MCRAAAALTLFLSVAAASDWMECVGGAAPGGTTTWIRSCEGTNYDHLLGRVIVVAYWGPSREGARDDVFLMQELHERIYRRGGRLLALTEASDDATRALLAEEDLFCAVGVETKIVGGSGSELPYAYVIDPKGTVLWQGQLRELPGKALDGALRQAKPFGLPRIHDMQEKSAKLYGKGKLVEAACDAMFMAEFSKDYFKGNARRIQLITEDANYIKARTEAYRAYWWGLVEEGMSRSDFDQVLYALEEIRLHLGEEPSRAADFGIRTGDDKRAVEQREGLRKNPLVDRSLKATKSYEALVGKQESARLTAATKAQLLQRFEEFQREWDGTCAARRAARRAKWVEGLPVEVPKGADGTGN